MSDVITKVCAVCGALKPLPPDTSAWVRVFGVTIGSSPQPIQVFRPQQPGRQSFPGLNNSALDFCPTCAAKTTVDKLPALLTTQTNAK